MKNLKLLSLSIGLYVLLGFSSSVNAQHVGQGSFMVGGSLHFESVSFDIAQTDDRSSFFVISPNVGYFPIDNLGLGLSAGYSRANFQNETVHIYTLGPYARYYVYSGLYPQVKFVWEKDEDPYFGDSTSTGFEFSLGYTVFLNESVALEPAVFYKTHDNYDSYGLQIGFQAFLGR